jgi:hypothetical protein
MGQSGSQGSVRFSVDRRSAGWVSGSMDFQPGGTLTDHRVVLSRTPPAGESPITTVGVGDAAPIGQRRLPGASTGLV